MRIKLKKKFTKEAGFLSYYESILISLVYLFFKRVILLYYFYLVCQKIKQNWTRVFHAEHRVPYIFNDKEWVGYDDIFSLSEKACYINEHDLGGAMFWALDLDDFSGKFCNQVTYLDFFSLFLYEFMNLIRID